MQIVVCACKALMSFKCDTLGAPQLLPRLKQIMRKAQNNPQKILFKRPTRYLNVKRRLPEDGSINRLFAPPPSIATPLNVKRGIVYVSPSNMYLTDTILTTRWTSNRKTSSSLIEVTTKFIVSWSEARLIIEIEEKDNVIKTRRLKNALRLVFRVDVEPCWDDMA